MKGEAPSKKVYEDDESVVVENIYPVAETHLLVIPKKHIATFMDLESDMDYLVKVVQKVITKLGIKNGYKLGINGGKYQSIGHFHIHILAGKLENEDDVFNKT